MRSLMSQPFTLFCHYNHTAGESLHLEKIINISFLLWDLLGWKHSVFVRWSREHQYYCDDFAFFQVWVFNLRDIRGNQIWALWESPLQSLNKMSGGMSRTPRFVEFSLETGNVWQTERYVRDEGTMFIIIFVWMLNCALFSLNLETQ